eukprot:TRINITY_DN3881_c0_g3_i1.p1 TRINITY_DN3881_c0_g3~~TRINITY_DN3881_c0_g3_i1.p1  ORF type:complete len:282 (-),score=88.94 TRINITY_DN3881_c0_g3_i1:69-914(-)
MEEYEQASKRYKELKSEVENGAKSIEELKQLIKKQADANCNLIADIDKVKEITRYLKEQLASIGKSSTILFSWFRDNCMANIQTIVAKYDSCIAEYKKLLTESKARADDLEKFKEELIADFRALESDKKEQEEKTQKTIEELEQTVKAKNEEMMRVSEEFQKSLMESEEVQLLVAELNQTKELITQKNAQLEEMYNKIYVLEESNNSKGDDVKKESEELRAKIEELEKYNEELMIKNDQLQGEYFLFLNARYEQLQNQHLELIKKYKEASYRCSNWDIHFI